VGTLPLITPGFRRIRASIAGWLDDIETGWSIPAFVLGFVALSTLILSIAYINSNLHMDVLETWSVGRTWAWGFWKHPPLMGWLAHGWMDVFPLTDWSFCVNRRSNLTPYRLPILTPLSSSVWR